MTPTFITQMQSLLQQAGGWISGLGIAGGGSMLAYHALMRNLNDDPQAVAHHSSSMKKVLTGTAIVAASGGLAAFVGHFF